MKINEQQQLLRQRGQLAQSFLESEFCQQFLFPWIERERMGGYPVPDKDGWQEQYRLAYAKDTVYTELFNTMKNWVSEAKEIDKYEQSEIDITLA